MNRTREKGKMLGVVLMMLFVGMTASQGFALTVPPPEGDDRITLVGGVWTLQESLNETIEIVQSNLTLDGNGKTVTGTGSGKGVEIVDKTNVTVRNMNITDSVTGIYVSNWGLLDPFGGHNLVGNTVNNSTNHGIYIIYSTDNTIEGNTITNSENYHGIYLSTDCSNNEIKNNTLGGNKGCGIMISDKAYTGCNNNQIIGNLIEGNGTGLYLHSAYNNIIYNNNFIGNTNGQVGGNYTSGNTYNMDSPIGGNYWSDWDEDDGYYDVNPEDGFIDTPRDLPGGTDELPLAGPYSEIKFMIRSIIVFFDECLSKDPPTIVPSEDKGRPEEKRLPAFRDMLVKAQDMIESENYDSACKKLDKALAACGGEVPPPELITYGTSGEEDLNTLIAMIVTLKGLLGCP